MCSIDLGASFFNHDYRKKKMKEFKSLIDYVDNWNKTEGCKPANEPTFILEFVKLLENYPDDREVSFNGEGSYFGKQVTLSPFSFWGKSPKQLSFEVAYSKDEIRVYSANHNGFWQPEFISIKSDNVDFEEFKRIWFEFLTKVFGL